MQLDFTFCPIFGDNLWLISDIVKCQKQLKDIKTSVETGKYPNVDKLLAHNTNFGMA